MKKTEKEMKDSLGSRASKTNRAWKGIAFNQEKVVNFAFGIDRIVDNYAIFGLVIEKNRLGVKIFDIFNKILSKYIRDVEMEILGHKFTMHYGKPEFHKFRKKTPANWSIDTNIGAIGYTWRIYGEDKEHVIHEIEKLLSCA